MKQIYLLLTIIAAGLAVSCTKENQNNIKEESSTELIQLRLEAVDNQTGQIDYSNIALVKK